MEFAKMLKREAPSLGLWLLSETASSFESALFSPSGSTLPKKSDLSKLFVIKLNLMFDLTILFFKKFVKMESLLEFLPNGSLRHGESRLELLKDSEDRGFVTEVSESSHDSCTTCHNDIRLLGVIMLC